MSAQANMEIAAGEASGLLIEVLQKAVQLAVAHDLTTAELGLTKSQLQESVNTVQSLEATLAKEKKDHADAIAEREALMTRLVETEDKLRQAEAKQTEFDQRLAEYDKHPDVIAEKAKQAEQQLAQLDAQRAELTDKLAALRPPTKEKKNANRS